MSERTREQAHEANNAVIAIAQDAARRYGVHLVLVVGGDFVGNEVEGESRRMMVGVDARSKNGAVVVQLAGMLLGAVSMIDAGVIRETQAELLDRAIVSGADNARALWDRDAIGDTIDGEQGSP